VNSLLIAVADYDIYPPVPASFNDGTNTITRRSSVGILNMRELINFMYVLRGLLREGENFSSLLCSIVKI